MDVWLGYGARAPRGRLWVEPKAGALTGYAGTLRQLLPRGRVWPTEVDTTQSKVLLGLARTAERADAAATNLLVDAFPATTIDLLPEWGHRWGCPTRVSDQTRPRISVARRFARGSSAQGRPTAEMTIGYAAAIGFVISLTYGTPFRAGRARAGQPAAGVQWAYACRVRILSSAGSLQNAAFRAGRESAGERLNTASAALETLACELRQIVPAQVVVLITF